MTVQSISSVSAYFINTRASSFEDNKDSFDSVLEKKNIKAEIGKKTETGKKTEQKDKTFAEENKQTDSVMNSDSNTITAETKKVSSDNTDITSTETIVTENINELQGETVLEDTEVSLGKIIELLNEIICLMQENLQVTENELQAAAQENGLQPADLFNMESVKQLTMTVTGTDEAKLLTDEDMCKKLLDLQTQISDLLEENGIQPEELQNDDLFSKKLNEVLLGTEKQSVEDQSISNRKEISFTVNEKQVKENSLPQSIDKTDGTEELKEQVKAPEDTTAERKESGENGHQFSENAGTFLRNLAAAGASLATEQTGAINTYTEFYEIASQVIEQVKVSVNPESTSMELQLYPEHLGKVDLQISSKDGIMTAQLTTQDKVAKEALESQMQVLRQTLENQGIKVESIEVTVSEFGFRQNENGAGGQEQQRKRNGSRVSFNEGTELDGTAINDVTEVMKELNGNSVDYVA